MRVRSSNNALVIPDVSGRVPIRIHRWHDVDSGQVKRELVYVK